MTQQVQDYLPRRINQYVPAMGYAADLVHGEATRFSLGSPAVADADGLIATLTLTLNSGSSTTNSTMDGVLGGELDATYGRTVTVTPSGNPGADVVVDLYGRDYLGQPMRETLTIANGQTTASESVKAFKWLDKVVHDGQASNAVTATVGSGSSLGLPYRLGELVYAEEGGTYTTPALEIVNVTANAVTISGTNAFTATAPIDGFCIGIHARITTATTTNPAVMDCKNGSTGVPALDLTVPVAAVGFVASNRTATGVAAQATTVGDSWTWTSNGGPDAGAAVFTAEFAYNTPQAIQRPVLTDPQTATTFDPRGLYNPRTTLDGSTEIVVYMTANKDVNSSGNGGLHGIAHYYA